MAIENMSTRALVTAYRRIRAMWREMPWPKDGVFPMEDIFSQISAELHARGYFDN